VAKENRGLPSSFKIDIPDRPRPVELGDYLDEVESAPVARPAPKPAAPSPAPTSSRAPEKVVEFRKQASPAITREDVTEPQRPPMPQAEPDSQAQLKRRRRRIPKAPPRKQINTTPETQRMIDEIIDYVQSYSVQRDAKASEIFHALVLALHESIESLDLSTVPARGRWGTPTAQAFPISLKSAIKAAIANSHKKNQR
jgi:hypothetical protein